MDNVKIIKIGGAVIEDDDKLDAFLQDFCALEGKKILIHGGGRTATLLADKMQVTSAWHQGRRITDDKMLEIVIMTYGGLVNKRIVSRIQANKMNAIGLTGADGNLMTSVIREKVPVDFGWVGDPAEVNGSFLMMLMEHEYVPVVAPLTHDGKGHILNTNADSITYALSTTLAQSCQVDTIFCFEFEGVLEDINNPSSLISRLDEKRYIELKQDGIIEGGMIPKLENAFKMIKNGVSSVRIIHFGQIGRLNSSIAPGTSIHK